MKKTILLFLSSLILFSCSDEDKKYEEIIVPFQQVKATFGNRIDVENLANYANQPIPNYITRFNGQNNSITDKGATLGRVLFYDKNLSSNNTISCASCHQQANGFSDIAIASQGVNGTTGRHSMRLINARFGAEAKFFWD
jgi:cytochrome c peroxidase